MTVEGLCQECGDYIPMPDPDDENDPLWKLDKRKKPTLEDLKRSFKLF